MSLIGKKCILVSFLRFSIGPSMMPFFEKKETVKGNESILLMLPHSGSV